MSVKIIKLRLQPYLPGTIELIDKVRKTSLTPKLDG